MDDAEFDKLIKDTGFGDRARRALRLVLVDGQGFAAAAEAVGMSRQAVHKAVERFDRHVRKNRQIPDNWQTVTLYLPPGLASSARYMHDRAARAAGLNPAYNERAPEVTKGERAVLVDLLSTARIRPP